MLAWRKRNRCPSCVKTERGCIPECHLSGCHFSEPDFIDLAHCECCQSTLALAASFQCKHKCVHTFRLFSLSRPPPTSPPLRWCSLSFVPYLSFTHARHACATNKQCRLILQRKTNRSPWRKGNRYTFNATYKATHQSISNGEFRTRNSIWIHPLTQGK